MKTHSQDHRCPSKYTEQGGLLTVADQLTYQGHRSYRDPSRPRRTQENKNRSAEFVGLGRMTTRHRLASGGNESRMPVGQGGAGDESDPPQPGHQG